MQLFYAPNIATSLELPEEEALHALRVFRLQEGNELLITDGKGCLYKALISEVDGRRCQVRIMEISHQPPLWPGSLHIALSPTRHTDRIEWFVEKATEIGIDTITFLQCRFSGRPAVRLPRMEKIAISAMKQSLKLYLPELTGTFAFQSFVTQPFDGCKYIAHCHEGADKPLLQHCYPLGKSALILIGPEGDFSPEEVELATANGFKPVSLGKSRLRTETAALVACHTIQLLHQA